MKNVASLTLANSLFFSLLACSSQAQTVDATYLAVARASLPLVEGKSAPPVYVASPAIDANARAALVALGRTVIAPDAVPYSERDELPPGYFLLSKFEVAAETAAFEGTRGPIGRPSGKALAWTCGTSYKLPVYRAGGEWKVGKYSTIVC